MHDILNACRWAVSVIRNNGALLVARRPRHHELVRDGRQSPPKRQFRSIALSSRDVITGPRLPAFCSRLICVHVPLSARRCAANEPHPMTTCVVDECFYWIDGIAGAGYQFSNRKASAIHHTTPAASIGITSKRRPCPCPLRMLREHKYPPAPRTLALCLVRDARPPHPPACAAPFAPQQWPAAPPLYRREVMIADCVSRRCARTREPSCESAAHEAVSALTPRW